MIVNGYVISEEFLLLFFYCRYDILTLIFFYHIKLSHKISNHETNKCIMIAYHFYICLIHYVSNQIRHNKNKQKTKKIAPHKKEKK